MGTNEELIHRRLGHRSIRNTDATEYSGLSSKFLELGAMAHADFKKLGESWGSLYLKSSNLNRLSRSNAVCSINLANTHYKKVR